MGGRWRHLHSDLRPPLLRSQHPDFHVGCWQRCTCAPGKGKGQPEGKQSSLWTLPASQIFVLQLRRRRSTQSGPAACGTSAGWSPARGRRWWQRQAARRRTGGIGQDFEFGFDETGTRSRGQGARECWLRRARKRCCFEKVRSLDGRHHQLDFAADQMGLALATLKVKKKRTSFSTWSRATVWTESRCRVWHVLFQGRPCWKRFHSWIHSGHKPLVSSKCK